MFLNVRDRLPPQNSKAYWADDIIAVYHTMLPSLILRVFEMIHVKYFENTAAILTCYKLGLYRRQIPKCINVVFSPECIFTDQNTAPQIVFVLLHCPLPEKLPIIAEN